MGLGLRPSFLSSSSWRFSRAGYIIRKRQMPMGIEMPRICQESSAWPMPGTSCERAIPAAMQSATHSAIPFSQVLMVPQPPLSRNRSASIEASGHKYDAVHIGAVPPVNNRQADRQGQRRRLRHRDRRPAYAAGCAPYP